MRLLLTTVLLMATTVSMLMGSDTTRFVRAVRISGNERTIDEVILREMFLKAGSRITPVGIAIDEDRIYNLRLFNRVQILLEEVGDTLATLHVKVDERWYIIPKPKGGKVFSDWKKLYYGLTVQDNNFRGRNQQLDVTVILGFTKSFGFAFTSPRFLDEEDLLFGITASTTMDVVRSPRYGEYSQRWINGGIAVGKRFDYFRSMSVGVGYTQYRTDEYAADRTLSPGGEDKFLSSSIQYRYDTRDLSEYATSGTLMQLGFEKYGLGESEVDVVRLTSDARTFIELFPKAGLGFRVLSSIRTGGSVPPYLYEQIGYSLKVRGYPGSTDEGERMIFTSTELRIPLIPPFILEFPWIPVEEFQVQRYALYWTLFADAATLWYRGEDPRSKPWYAGFGGGFHLLMPYSIVGRLEFAMNRQRSFDIVLDIDASF